MFRGQYKGVEVGGTADLRLLRGLKFGGKLHLANEVQLSGKMACGGPISCLGRSRWRMTHSNVGGAIPPTARLQQNGQARHHDGQDGRQASLLEHSSSPQKIGTY